MALRTPLTAQPHLYIGDSTGRPLDYGMVYFGEPNKDPEFYPIKVYLDAEMTIEAAQPLRTQGGFMSYGGDLVELYAEEVIYSLKVLDQYRRQIFYKPEMYRNNVSDSLQDEVIRATAAELLLATKLNDEVSRATEAEQEISENLSAEITRATEADQELDIKIISLSGGRKSYKTYADMLADAENIPANSTIDVIADTADKNGTYGYDGSTFTKSLYDVLSLSKSYLDNNSKADIVPLITNNIDYTTANRTLSFANTIFIFSNTTRYLLSTPQSVELTSNTPYRLEYEIGTGNIIAKPYSHALVEGNLVLGFVYATSSNIKTTDFLYTVNGVDNNSVDLSQVGQLHGIASSVSINTTTAIISISNARVIADNGYTVVVNASIDYSASKTSAATHYIYYSKSNANITYKSHTLDWLNQSDLVLIATFIPSTGDIRGLPQAYQRNGQYIGGAPTTNTGVLLSTSDSLDFDFSNQQIVVSSLTQILHGGLRVLVPVQTIDISSYTSSLWFALATDTTGALKVIATNTAYSRDLIIVGAFKKDTKSVVNIDNYSIDGVSNKSSGSAIPVDVVSAKLPSLGWDLQGVYTAPTMPAYRSSGADPLRAIDITSTTIDNWFDSLVAADPDYATKTHLGDEYTGLPINEYRFKPDMGGSTKPIKVLIHGGTHGEPMSYLLPYHMMQLITEQWQNDPILEALRFGVEFSVVPAVNAWGIANGNDRYNSRGINLNRNYPIGWSATGDNTGANPLSELETQYAYANMVDFDAHVAIDLHSYGTTDAGEFLWITTDSSDEGVTVGASMMNRMRQKWVKETPDIVAASALDRNAPTLATGSTMLTMKELGAIAVTFECGTKIIGEQPVAEHYSALAVRYGVEALINYLVIMLRRNA